MNRIHYHHETLHPNPARPVNCQPVFICTRRLLHAPHWLHDLFPAGSCCWRDQTNPISYPLTQLSLWEGTITAAQGNQVTLTGSNGPVPNQPGLYLTLRNGAYAGLSVPVLTFQGNDIVTLGEAPAGAFAAGLAVSVKPYDTIDSTFPPATMPLAWLRGTTAEAADNLILWQAATQSPDIYFLTPSANGNPSHWEKDGQPGDAGATTVGYPASFLIVRRGASPMELMNIGTVPTTNRRWQQIWGGLNLLGTPFNIETSPATLRSCGLYNGASAFSISAGLTALEADSLTIFDIASRQTATWCSVENDPPTWFNTDTNQDVSDMPLPFQGALMIYHYTAPTWVQLAYPNIPDYPPPALASMASMAATNNATQARTATRAQIVRPTVSGKIIPSSIRRVSAKHLEISWPARRGMLYRIQINTGSGWKTLSHCYAHAATMAIRRHFTGSGMLRVVQ